MPTKDGIENEPRDVDDESLQEWLNGLAEEDEIAEGITEVILFPNHAPRPQENAE